MQEMDRLWSRFLGEYPHSNPVVRITGDNLPAAFIATIVQQSKSREVLLPCTSPAPRHIPIPLPVWRRALVLVPLWAGAGWPVSQGIWALCNQSLAVRLVTNHNVQVQQLYTALYTALAGILLGAGIGVWRSFTDREDLAAVTGDIALGSNAGCIVAGWRDCERLVQAASGVGGGWWWFQRR